jgi:hypothetical protein
VQFKPHFIAAGSLYHAAKFENFKLPSEAWWNEFWNEFDVAPEQQLQGITTNNFIFVLAFVELFFYVSTISFLSCLMIIYTGSCYTANV